jgi:pilus assembly protein FimV
MRGSVIRFLFAACFALPVAAHAAGLGRLTVQSALGEPLRAEVEITSLQSGEENSLSARLGSPEAFKAAGIEYSPTLTSIRVAMDRRDGKPILRLTSLRAIDDPFLDVIIELQWSTGRLVREYTFLLDPPQYRDRPAAVAPAPSPAQQVAKPTPVPQPAAPEARPLAPRPGAAAPRAATTTGNTYEVKKGDTLGKIARDTAPEGVTMQQMLVALYRANQGAFIQNNMNLVRAGRILQIPDRDAVAGVSGADAGSVIRQHNAAWSDYRAKLGGAVAATPATSAPGRQASGRISPKPEAPATGSQRDQLKLSKADPAKPGAARAAREDDKTSSDRALKEAQSRVTDLEKNVSDLQKLVEMKNKQLAQLEQQAKPAAAASAKDAPKPAAEAPKPAPAPAPVAAAPKPAAEAPKPAAEAPKPAPEAPKPAAEAPKPAAAAPKAAEAPKAPAPAAAKPKPKPPAPEPSLVDEFLGNPAALGGLGGVVLLLAGYGTYAWRKKKATQSRFQDSVLAADAPAPAPPPAPDAHVVETAAAVSAAVAATQATASAPAAEHDDVDPIAEADVYLAYGRDAQAEEILNEALNKHPDRVPVHAKLLEIFAHRHDAKAFEKTAKAIQDLTHGSGPEWEKACALGRTVDPENTLYGGTGAAATTAAPVAPAAAPSVDFDLGGGATAEAQPAAPAVDFDIGAATTVGGGAQPFKAGDTMILQPGEVPPTAPPAAEAKIESLDFDINALGPVTQSQPQPAPAAAPHQDAGASLDFDLDLDLGTAKPAAAPAAAPVDITTISLDLGKPGSGSAGDSADPRWQEVATKLDLAKAYQGMGDKDGARELLNEVIAQGDAAQQNEAKQMLAGLG